MLFGTVAGIAFNFFTLGGYAFRDLSPRSIPRFVLGYAFVYVATLWLPTSCNASCPAQSFARYCS